MERTNEITKVNNNNQLSTKHKRRWLSLENKTQNQELIEEIEEIRLNLTPVLAVKSPMQLSGHRKENQELILNLLVIEITRLSESMHTSLKLTSNEIAVISRDILKDYWMLKFEEIILILEKVRKTKNYNRLDQSVIFSFIDDYVSKERQNLIDKARIEEKKQQEEENKEQEAMIRQLYEDVKAGKRKLYNDELNELHRNEKIKQQTNSQKEAEYILWREQYNKEQTEKAFKEHEKEQKEF